MMALGSNVWPSVNKKTEKIAAALKRAPPGSFEFNEIDPPPTGVGSELRPRSVSESPYSINATISSTRTYQRDLIQGRFATLACRISYVPQPRRREGIVLRS